MEGTVARTDRGFRAQTEPEQFPPSALPVARSIGLGAEPVAGNPIYRVPITCLLQHDALPDQKHRQANRDRH